MPEKQKILVLDGEGFIGKRVVQALAASDWAAPVAAGHRAASLDGVAGIVNCVVGSNQTIVDSARALSEAAASREPPPRIVHVSSVAVYGEAEGEVDEAASGVALGAYGTARLTAEGLAAAARSVVILRHGLVYGPGSDQWTTRIARLLEARRLGDLGRNGDGCCNLVYIDDEVDAILRSLRLPGTDNRLFNLSLPRPPTWNEYLIGFARALGAVPVMRVTDRSLRLQAKLLAPPQKILELLTGKIAPSFARHLPAPLPPSLLRLFRQELRMNVGAAEAVLGMRWTPLEQGLTAAARWYLDTKRGKA